MEQTEKIVERILAEIKKVVVGKDAVVEKVLMAMLARGHVLLEDIPGVGKTTLALAFGRAMGLSCKRIQFTPDTLPSDVTGFTMYEKAQGAFVYKEGAAMTNLLLADEINRTSSKTQSALLEIMEEGNVTVDGVTHPLPRPFFVISTQNPLGFAGTQMLPESQLDRFIVRLSMGYPDAESQLTILKDRQKEQPLDRVEQVTDAEGILSMQTLVDEIYVSDAVLNYMIALAEATRGHELVSLGVSPRGILALSRMAKARAFMRGSDYVLPEDVIDVFPDVCGHRLILRAKSRLSGVTEADVAGQILETVKNPVL